MAKQPQPKPASLSAAAVDTEEEDVKKAVASHFYLKDATTIVDDEEDAEGFRYVLIGAESQPLNWLWDEATEPERKLLAIFGGKTLAGNESSILRNNKKKSAEEKSPALQAQAVLDRFALLRQGQWVDRTREPGGPRVDKDILANAIVNVKIDAGKIHAKDAGTELATVRQKLDDDGAYLKMARSKAPVQAAYAKLVAEKAGSVSLDDL